MRTITLAGISLAFALGQAVAQTGGPGPGTAGSTGLSPGTTTQAAPGSTNTQRGAASMQGGSAATGGDRMTTSRSASSGATTSDRGGSTRQSGKMTSAGNERYRRELAECNQFSGDTKRSCIQGMHSARADGFYRN